MSQYVPVNIYVVDSTPAANPVSGVLVRVFTQDGLTVITEATTDGTGLAGFMLASDFTYQVRFFKFQVSIKNPQFIQVLDPPAQNGFTVVATLLTPPLSQDPRLCVAFGYFRTVTGAPAPNTDIQFISKFDPLIMDGSAVTNERQIARTDQNGYVQIPLIRFGQYSVIVAGMEDLRRDISVPDAPNVNLADLIFPVVSEIIFTPTGPFTVHIGTDFQTTTQLVTSDENPDPNSWDVIWSTDNPSVCAVLSGAPTLTLRGFQVGTCNLIAKRSNNTIIKIPDPGIIGIPQVINVVTP
jgi:hypothetical protein